MATTRAQCLLNRAHPRQNSMSFLRRSASARVQQPQLSPTDMHISIEPTVHPGELPSANKMKAINDVVTKMKTACPELFSTPNKCVRSFQGGDIYHTQDYYGNSSSVEEMLSAAKTYDICLMVNAISPTLGSTAACLDKVALEKALESGSKTVELKVGLKGRMNISLRQEGSSHFIDTIDYHIGNK